MSTDIKRIDIAEFREFGYLQEVNRRFFHPLGLALEVVIEDCPECDGTGTWTEQTSPEEAGHGSCTRCNGVGKLETLGGVWDSRDDPEGYIFAGEGMIDQDKIDRVQAEWNRHGDAREKLFGRIGVVQRPGEEPTE